ncbi:hypothetical protein [Pseudomonas sp. H1_D05]
MQATALLFLYLCTDASRLDCQAIPVQQWVSGDAYDQCARTAHTLESALTPANRPRHRFVCETPDADSAKTESENQPHLTLQSFRL